MKDLLIGRKIYINLIQDRAKNRKCSEAEVAPNVLNKLPNYSYIPYFSYTQKINHNLEIACVTVVGMTTTILWKILRLF
jgi:hypothetical protein